MDHQKKGLYGSPKKGNLWNTKKRDFMDHQKINHKGTSRITKKKDF